MAHLKSPHATAATSPAGFSLLEVLVAVAILATASLALFSLSSTSTATSTASKDRVTAAALATNRLELLRDTGFDSLVAGNYDDGGPIGADGSSGGAYTRSWTISDTTVAGADTKHLRVEVTWAEGQSVALESRLVDSGPVTTALFLVPFDAVAVRAWRQER